MHIFSFILEGRGMEALLESYLVDGSLSSAEALNNGLHPFSTATSACAVLNLLQARASSCDGPAVDRANCN